MSTILNHINWLVSSVLATGIVFLYSNTPSHSVLTVQKSEKSTSVIQRNQQAILEKKVILLYTNVSST